MHKLKKCVLPLGIIEGRNIFDNEEYDYINMLAAPSEEAYLLKITEDDLVTMNHETNIKSIRRIFSVSNQWLPHEIEELASFKAYLKEHAKSSSKIIQESVKDSEMLRFLQATGYKYNKTIDFIKSNIDWRAAYFPFELTEPVIEILKSGFIYTYGRDHKFRPILIINPGVYLRSKGNYSYADWLHAIIYFMEYLIHHLLIPGQVENWCMITDLRGVSIFNLPSEVKDFLRVMQSNYRARLRTNFLIGMGMILRGIWAVVSSALDPETNKKIKILGNKGFDEIFENINRSQVERKFEGSSQNLTENYFPPSIPQDREYLNLKIPKTEQLHTREAYIKLLNEGKIVTPSPFILAELEIEKESEEKKRHELERQAYLEELRLAKDAKEKYEQKHFELEKRRLQEESANLKSKKTTERFFDQDIFKILNEPTKDYTKLILKTQSHKVKLGFDFGKSPFIS